MRRRVKPSFVYTFNGHFALTIATMLLLAAFCSAATQPSPQSRPTTASSPTLPLLVFFRLSHIPANISQPWVLAKVLPWKRTRTETLMLGANDVRARVLAAPHEKNAPTGILTLGLKIRKFEPITPFLSAQIDSNLSFRAGQVILARLEQPREINEPGFNFRCRVYPVELRYDIPLQYADQFAPAFNFYNAHRGMFSLKASKADQKKLLAILTVKNIFLAQEAWVTLLKAIQIHEPWMAKPVPPTPLTKKYVEHLLPKLGPNRQTYFIYEILTRHKYAPQLAAVSHLVANATDSKQLVPAATACAYRLAWFGQSSSPKGGARGMLMAIEKKSASFDTHNAADKKIERLIKLSKSLEMSPNTKP